MAKTKKPPKQHKGCRRFEGKLMAMYQLCVESCGPTPMPKTQVIRSPGRAKRHPGKGALGIAVLNPGYKLHV